MLIIIIIIKHTTGYNLKNKLTTISYLIDFAVLSKSKNLEGKYIYINTIDFQQAYLLGTYKYRHDISYCMKLAKENNPVKKEIKINKNNMCIVFGLQSNI
jgi:hypothetical protein